MTDNNYYVILITCNDGDNDVFSKEAINERVKRRKTK